MSWAAAPLITGIFGALFFWFIRRFVLRSSEPYQRSVKIYPVTIFLAVGLDLFMVLYKAGKNNPQIKEWGLKFQLPVAFGISGVLAVLFYFFLSPFLTRRIAAKFDKEDDKAVELGKVEEGVQVDGENGEKTAENTTVKDILKANGEDDDSVDEAPKGDAMKKSARSNLSVSERMKTSVHKSMKKLGDVSFHKLLYMCIIDVGFAHIYLYTPICYP